MIADVLKNIGRDSFIYGISRVLARGIDFMIIPLLTRMFNPLEYGFIELVNSTIAILGIIVAMGTNTAFYYYYNKPPFHQDIEQRNHLFQGVLAWNTFLAGLAALLILWALFAFDSPYMAEFGVWGMAVIALYVVLKIIDQRYLELFRISEKPSLFLVSRVVLSLLMLVFISILYFSSWHTLQYYFICLLIVSAVVLLVEALWAGKKVQGYKLSLAGIRYWPKLLKFGVGVVPGAIAMVLHNVSDRWMLEYYDFQEGLGLYAIAAKFGAVVALGVSIFTMAFQPMSMKMIHDDDTQKVGNILDVLLRYYILLTGAGAIVLASLSPYIITFLAPPEYASAVVATPFLCLSAVMFGVTYFTSLGTWKYKKTLYFSGVLIISAVLNIVLNIILLPKIGMAAAALTTGISMTFLVVLSFYIGQAFYKLAYHQWRIIAQLLVLFIFCFYQMLILQSDNYTYPFIDIFVVLLVLSVLTITPVDIDRVRQYLKEKAR